MRLPQPHPRTSSNPYSPHWSVLCGIWIRRRGLKVLPGARPGGRGEDEAPPAIRAGCSPRGPRELFPGLPLAVRRRVQRGWGEGVPGNSLCAPGAVPCSWREGGVALPCWELLTGKPIGDGSPLALHSCSESGDLECEVERIWVALLFGPWKDSKALFQALFWLPLAL